MKGKPQYKVSYPSSQRKDTATEPVTLESFCFWVSADAKFDTIKERIKAMKKDSTPENKRKRKCRAKQAEAALEKLLRVEGPESFEVVDHKFFKGSAGEWIDQGPLPRYILHENGIIAVQHARAKFDSDSEETLSERSEPSLE